MQNEPGGPAAVSAYPALLAAEWPDIIVVGAVSTDGQEWYHSQQGSLVAVWAPGVDVECANNVGRGIQFREGTSIATGMVSGLAAYFMALDPTLQKPGTGLTSTAVKSRLIAESFPRLENNPFYPNAVSNGLASPICPDGRDGDEAAEMGRRDANNGGSCSGLSTATTLRMSTTNSALSGPSSVLSKPCNDGQSYAELLSCEEGCFAGTCKYLQTKIKRCEGCDNGSQRLYLYKCSC